LQIDIRGKTFESARSTTAQVIDAIENATLFTGLFTSDNDEQKESAIETYRVSIDFSIWFIDL